MRPDLRLWPAAAGAWAGAAVVVGIGPPLGLVVAAFGVGVFIALTVRLLWRPVRGRTLATVVALALIAGAASATAASIRLTAVDSALLPEPGTPVEVVATVDSDPQRVVGRVAGIARGPDRMVFGATAATVEWNGGAVTGRVPARVWAPASGGILLPGTTIRVRAVTRPAERGIALVLTSRGDPVVVEEASAWQRAAGSLREGLRLAVEGMPADGAALLPALVLGDTSAMPDDLVDAMRVSGLAHLTAVSGANVSIVLLAALSLCAPLRVRGPMRAVVAAAALVGFVVLVRPSPSVVRAAAMGAVAVLALLVGGRRRGPPALAAAAWLLVMIDPELAVSLGFALSVAATAGLLLVAPSLLTLLERWRVPTPAGQALAVTVAAQLVTAPLLVLVAAPVGLGAVPANLLAEVAVAPATLLGLVATLLAPVSAGAAHAVAWLAVWCAQWIAFVAKTVSDRAALTLPIPGGAGGALAVTVAIVGGGLLVRHRSRLPSVPPVAVASTLAVVTVGALTLPRSSSWPPPGWVAVVCDVGQGDAIVVRADDGAAVVVDTGPDPRAVDRCLSDLGVRQVPALILTHFHADHVEGVPGVLRGRTVGEVLVSPLSEPTDEVERVARWCEGAGLEPTVVTAGDERQVGQVRWRVVWPSRLVRAEGSAPNNASVTVRVEVDGVSLLLGGDLEPAAQAALLGEGALTSVDVVKVPHHGSRRQHPRFGPSTGAVVAVVSVGVGNTYGHPAPETVASYETRGVPLWRTDRDGDVAVVHVDTGGVGIVARSGSGP